MSGNVQREGNAPINATSLSALEVPPRVGQITRNDLNRLARPLLLVPMVAFALLVASQLLPNQQVADALLAAGSDGPLAAGDHDPTFLNTLSDRWTECTALTIGLDDAHAGSPVESALHARTMGNCENSTDRLTQYAETGELTSTAEYYRYWWTSSALLQPAVVFLGVPLSRALFHGALIAATFTLFRAWQRRIGALAALALLGPIVVATDFVTLYDAMPQAISLGVALFVAALSIGWFERSTRHIQFFAAGSTAGAFLLPFDLMISIPLAATLTVATAMLVLFQRQASPKQLLVAGAAAGAGWGFGYAWVWATKWLAISLIVGPSKVLENITSTVAFRVNGETNQVTSSIIDGPLSNVRYWIDNDFAFDALLFELIVVLVAAALMIRRAKAHSLTGYGADKAARARLLIISMTAALPIVWYAFASNHSQIHNWIMFRALALSAGLIGVCLLLATQSHTPTQQFDDATPREPLAHHKASVTA